MKAIKAQFAWQKVAMAAAWIFVPVALWASGGQLWSMGQNSNGQLADGTYTSRSNPAQVVSGIAEVASGGSATEGSHTLYLKTDGTLWAMGYNLYGQLGDGTTTNRLTPVQVASSVSKVSAGINHSLFLKTNGTLWAMGFNQYGQLGDGSTTNRATPVQIDSGVSAVAAGGNHSLYLKTNGTLWAAGYNNFGQLGDGTKPTNQATPVQVATGVSALAAGGTHSLFLKTDNTIWVMGWNASGQLGVGPAYSYLGSPTQLVVTGSVRAIAAGNQHSLFLKTDGTLWAMGQNLFGQLGDGTMPTVQKTPVLVTDRVGALAAGASHSYFLKTDRTLWAMGLNTAGQLGDGATTNRSTPVPVADEVLSVSGGAEVGFFIKAPGLTTQLDTWTALASGPTNPILQVIYADSLFVGGTAGVAPAGGGGLSLVSADGLSWTASSAGALLNLDVTGCALGNGLYVAVGAIEVGSGGAIATATDGITWSASTAATQALRGIVFGQSKFVAVGDGGLIQTSVDGSAWTVRTSGTSQNLQGVVYSGSQFVAVGSAGTVLTSPEGTTWTVRAAGATNNFTSVAYGNSQFVAVGNGIVTSSDGVSWTQRVSVSSDGTNYHAVIYRIGQFVTVGVNSSAQGAVRSSPDGISWTTRTPSVASTLRGVAYGANRFVVVGDNGTVRTSEPVGSAPVVVTNPASQSIYAGSPVSFSVTVAGAPTLTYQWLKNNVAISGATSATYTIASCDTTDAGSLSVTVSNAAGNATSAAAVLTVLKADQAISFAALPTHYYGDAPFAISATASPSGLPVTFSVVSGPATVSGSTVTVTGIGFVTIRASQSGNISYYAAPNIDRSFTVAKATPVITWSNPAALTAGTALSSTQLNATASVAGSFTYSPASGAVLSAGAQTLSVSFSPTDTTNYFSATAQQTLTVNKVTVSVTLGSLSATYDGVAHAATATTSVGVLTMDFTYNGSATLPINAGSYAVVGTVNNASYAGSASGTFVITPASQTITFAALANRTTATAPFSVSATASPSALPVSFSVLSGPATLASNILTLTATGTVTIRASQSGNTNYLAATNVDRSFSVTSPVPTITWSVPAAISYGTALGSTQLNATASVPGTFVYSPASGAVLNAGAQTLAATFTPTDTASYAAATAQQSLTVTKLTPPLTWGAPAAITYGTALDSTQLNATAGSLGGSFTYNPASGAVLAAGTQTLNATFTPVDSTNYNSATAQQTLTVGKASATVALGGLNAAYDGTPKSATATTSPSVSAVGLTYNGNATAPTNLGSYAVVATISDATYSGSASGTLTIAQGEQTISFGALPDRSYGDATFGVSATASPSSLPVSFLVLSGPATLSGNLVTVTGAGVVTIRASQSGDANFNTAINIDRTFNVAKAIPAISWPEPAAIGNGTALSGMQLNAVANIPGVIVYNPASGIVLPAGTMTLSLIFTPTESTRYSTIALQRSLTVNTAPDAPVFSVQPQSQTVVGGAATTFSALASAALSPVYRWQKNGYDIPGTTGSSYTIVSAAAADVGIYQVIATNAAGSTASLMASLEVNIAPVNGVVEAPSNVVVFFRVE